MFVVLTRCAAVPTDHIGVSVYTQTTDIEAECDGGLSYDRMDKFDSNQAAYIRAAQQSIIDANRCMVLGRVATIEFLPFPLLPSNGPSVSTLVIAD